MILNWIYFRYASMFIRADDKWVNLKMDYVRQYFVSTYVVR